MRESLFRGKRIYDGTWVYGNLFIPDREDTPTQICCGTHIIRINYDVIPETVGQETGLKDKNGNKIFEGDICSSGKSIYEIVWNENMHGYYCKVFKSDCCLITTRMLFPIWHWNECAGTDCLPLEVIGNIHDNPEFLKGGASE